MMHVISIGKWEPEYYYVESQLSHDEVLTLARIGNQYCDSEHVRWRFSVGEVTESASDFSFSSLAVLVHWDRFFDWDNETHDQGGYSTTPDEASWQPLNSAMAQQLIYSWQVSVQDAQVSTGDNDWSWELGGIRRFADEARRRGLLPAEQA